MTRTEARGEAAPLLTQKALGRIAPTKNVPKGREGIAEAKICSIPAQSPSPLKTDAPSATSPSVGCNSN